MEFKNIRGIAVPDNITSSTKKLSLIVYRVNIIKAAYSIKLKKHPKYKTELNLRDVNLGVHTNGSWKRVANICASPSEAEMAMVPSPISSIDKTVA
jgi:hypothetical protein